MTHLYRNYYQCPDCAYEWEDEWDCQVDDECPNCHSRHITPYASDDLDPDDMDIDRDDDDEDF